MRRFRWLASLFISLALEACGSSAPPDSSNGTPGAGSESDSSSSTTGASTSGATSAATTTNAGNSSTTGTSTSGATSAATTTNAGSSSGSSDAGGQGDSAGTDAGASLCRPKFASGVNVAWFDYASDVPLQSGPPSTISEFNSLYTNVYNAGGRIVRWWFHTNGAVTPGYTNGQATPISQSNIDDVKSILDAAYAAGMAVNISLWAFDMLSGGQNAPVADNLQLLTDDTARQAYITNVLTPLVTALKGYHGLYSWEIFNEPEGMTPPSPNGNGWTTCASSNPNCGAPAGGESVSEAVIQENVNWFADAIHNADPNALVTVGAWTFIANSNVNGWTNFYSDAALMAAGGRSKGTLDYYEVHYYDNWGSPGGAESVSPFQYPASHWGLTDGKPIVIGEFWDIDTYDNGTSTIIPSANLYTTLYTNGYAGAWAWQYANPDNPGPADYPNNSEQTTWGPLMQTSIQNLYSADTAAVECN